MSLPADLDPKELRPLLHAEIDNLRDDLLGVAYRLLLELELQQAMEDLDDSVDQARANGHLTPETVAAAIAAHRAGHPYG